MICRLNSPVCQTSDRHGECSETLIKKNLYFCNSAFESLRSVGFFFKEIKPFFLQGYIKLIRSNSN